VLTVDNAPAQITVSQVIPFASSVKYDINGNPLIGYDYKEVGIKLKLTPRISETNIILDIHQEANDVIGYEKPTVGNVQYMVPITSKRELETQVNIDNGKTVVLGGMVSKKTTKQWMVSLSLKISPSLEDFSATIKIKRTLHTSSFS